MNTRVYLVPHFHIQITFYVTYILKGYYVFLGLCIAQSTHMHILVYEYGKHSFPLVYLRLVTYFVYRTLFCV